ncbi:hypothetical protein VNO77_09128 [Canavalia gladiata]|uniref:Uncharacterized protein n=1 Tax=Canavalia gladiata TaxID=3824 RepID=A0AAN9M9R7_CANGL
MVYDLPMNLRGEGVTRRIGNARPLGPHAGTIITPQHFLPIDATVDVLFHLKSQAWNVRLVLEVSHLAEAEAIREIPTSIKGRCEPLRPSLLPNGMVLVLYVIQWLGWLLQDPKVAPHHDKYVKILTNLNHSFLMFTDARSGMTGIRLGLAITNPNGVIIVETNKFVLSRLGETVAECMTLRWELCMIKS